MNEVRVHLSYLYLFAERERANSSQKSAYHFFFGLIRNIISSPTRGLAIYLIKVFLVYVVIMTP